MEPGDQINPYVAPESLPPALPAARFRWRLIPAVLLFVFGAAFLVIAPMVLYAAAERQAQWGKELTIMHGLIFGALAFTGSLWIGAGILCMRRRWLYCAAATIAGIATYAVAAIVFG